MFLWISVHQEAGHCFLNSNLSPQLRSVISIFAPIANLTAVMDCSAVCVREFR